MHTRVPVTSQAVAGMRRTNRWSLSPLHVTLRQRVCPLPISFSVIRCLTPAIALAPAAMHQQQPHQQQQRNRDTDRISCMHRHAWRRSRHASLDAV